MTEPSAMLKEISQLADDLAELVEPTLQAAAERRADWPDAPVTLTGCGDSLIAAEAMQSSFSRGAHVAYPSGVSKDSGRGPVVGISASGNTPAIVNALTRSRAKGRPCLLLTGSTGSQGAEAAGHELRVPLTNKIPRVPGIRSYQASLLGLAALALGTEADQAFRTLRASVADCAARNLDAARGAAALLAQSDAPVVFLGEGTDLSCAGYGLAKRIEATGQVSTARDTEEFWHLERFARRLGTVVLVTADGETTVACRMARVVKGLNAQLIVIAPQTATELADEADVMLDPGVAPHPLLAPFLAAIPLAALAAREAEIRQVSPFQTDAPERLQAMRQYIDISTQ